MDLQPKSSCFAPRTAALHETTFYTSPSSTPVAVAAHTSRERPELLQKCPNVHTTTLATTQVEMAKLAIALLAAPAAAFAPAAGRPGLAPLRNAFGVDATYPAFLPQGGVGGTGPMPGDDPMGVMPWEREAFSTVEADPSQLDSAFMAANGAALDAKLSKYSEAQRSELLGKKSDLEVLGMSDKDLDKFFNPPPPKAKK